jgi:hypothetical protein
MDKIIVKLKNNKYKYKNNINKFIWIGFIQN